ncbi:MAG: MarR family winged helix-turn-helix transcriptional regulator [Solirubrobacteraceae bacterium]|nr:MAG: MarR family transcriptional regulator [Solirubrobacterales bacterium]
MSTSLTEPRTPAAASATGPAAGTLPAPLSAEELAAWRGLLCAHAMLVKALDAELEAAHGFPLSSFEALEALASASGRRLRMCELAERARLSRSGLTRLADRLERAGLIERVDCASDARGSFAVLTAAGTAVLAAAGPTYADVIRRRLLDQLSEADLARLGRVCERVLEASPAREARGSGCCA